MGSPKPNTIIGTSPNEVVMTVNGNTRDIIRLILIADRLSGKFVDTQNAERLRGRDDYHTLENIFWFVKKNVAYKVDPNGTQDVRLPGYLFETATGDCKSYSVAIGAICRALGIPYRYRFIRQAGAANYHHVYIVATTPDGSARGPVLLDAVHRSFDSEPKYSRKLDIKSGQKIPAGIGGVLDTVPRGAWIIILLLIGLWAFNND